MPLFYHKYVNYVLAHSVNYVITLYRLAPPVTTIFSTFTNTANPHYPSPRTAPIQNPPPTAVTTILHFSFFIFHYLRHHPRHYRRHLQSALFLAIAPPKFKIRAIGATTILHSSFFIFHSPSSPPLFTIPRPALSKIEIRAAGKARML